MKSEKLIGSVGNKNYPIKISLSRYKGNEIIDIRKYYTNKQGELKPSKKGVSFTRTTLYPILKILANHIGEINDFFDANNKEKITSKKIENIDLENLIFEQIDSHKFFHAEKLGSKDNAIINENHPFGREIASLFKELNEIDERIAKKVKFLLMSLLKAYFFSQSHFEPEEYYTANSLFTDHEISWSSQLRRVIKEEE